MIFTVQTALFQLRLLGISDCVQWKVSTPPLSLTFQMNTINLIQEKDPAGKKEDMLNSVISAVDGICQCELSRETFYNVVFHCFDTTTAVTFRGEVGAAVKANSSQVISYMEQWVAMNPTIVIQSSSLSIDSKCNVKIDSFNDSECGSMMNDGGSVITDPIVGGVAGGVLATLIIAVSLVVIVVLIVRTCQKKASFKADRNTENIYE